MADLEKMKDSELEATETAEATSAPAKKAENKPAPKKQKAGIFARIGKWFRDLRAEAKKVIWPTKKQVVNNTIVVIVMVIVVAAFVALLDVSFQQVRNFLAQLFA